MCETCVDRLFRSGPGPCPICKTTLRKSNFTTQKFDDLYVEKEVQIRKKLSFINKRQEDFPSLRDYNDYLEETEEIIFNMINNVDIQETNERIERFRNENKELIERNKQKQLQEERLIQQRIQREKLEKQARKEAFLEIENKQLNEKQQSDLELISKIQTSSTKDLKTVMKENKYKKQKVDKVEIKIEMEEIEEDDDFDFEPVDTILNRISFINTNQYTSRYFSV
ncbi:TFIIH/NER complex subunit [Terramyces sp. JEL0728]|nr:TFIIH/NER complex subunit [Terramyces sp. JEL0728]